MKTERLPAVYLGGGGSLEGLAQTLEPALVRGAVLVGIESVQSMAASGAVYDPAIDDWAQEYLESWGSGEQRFLNHERLVLRTVLPPVEQAYGLSTKPRHRGWSAAFLMGAWAISMAALHPEMFQGVLALSPSSGGPQHRPHPAARVFAEGGTLEASFLSAARQYAALPGRRGIPPA